MRIFDIEFRPGTSAECFNATVLALAMLVFCSCRWWLTPWNTTPAQLFSYTTLTFFVVLANYSAFQFTEIDNILDIKRWAVFLLLLVVLAMMTLGVGIVIQTVANNSS